MLLNLRPFAVKRLAAAEANDDAAALQEAIDQAAVVVLPTASCSAQSVC